MTRASDNEFPSVLLDEQATAPTTPASGFWRVYAKSDGLYVVDDAGTETGPFGTGGAGAEFATGNTKIATAETTTSTSFADLATPGPSVTVTVGASGKVRLDVATRIKNTGANDGYVGVDISGASTVAASTILWHTGTVEGRYGAHTIVTGLTPGSTTFKMQYAVSAGTGTFTVRELTVSPVL